KIARVRGGRADLERPGRAPDAPAYAASQKGHRAARLRTDHRGAGAAGASDVEHKTRLRTGSRKAETPKQWDGPVFDAGKDCFTTRAIRRLGYWICETFFHIELTGVGHIPAEGPLIIAANHQTFIDPVFIMLPVYHKTYYMTWHKVFSIPLLAAL